MLQEHRIGELEPLICSRDAERIPYQSNYESLSENEDPNMVAHNTSAKDVPMLRHTEKNSQYIATLAATTGALAAGCVLGWSSPSENYIVKQEAYGFNVSNEQYSWIGSIATIGGVISCCLIGVVMDLLGRKNTMLLLIIPFSVGWSLIIWPLSVLMLYVGRFCVGFSGGAFFVVTPAYIGEIATNDVRGMLGSCLQLMITAGILLIYTLGYFFDLHTFNIICAILPLVFGAIFAWMPESPYFYIMNNNVEEAKKSLMWLRGEENNFMQELIEIQIEHEIITQNRSTFISALRKAATKRGLMITLILLFLTQLSGINAVIFYTDWIFKAANTDIESSVSTIVVGAMQVIATFVASMTVDRLGRRFLLVMSASIMCVCNLGLWFYFHLDYQKSDVVNHLHWLPIASLCIYIIAFSLGLGPIPWILVGELFSTEAKAIASSLSGATSWLVAFLVTKFFSNIRELIGVANTFFGFAVFAACATIFVAKAVPETKGKTFHEIQRLLHDEANNINGADDDNITITNASQNTIAM